MSGHVLPLVVIGAGPAGMAAATVAADLAVPTLVLDEQPAAGGQVYRNVERVMASRPATAALLGADYERGRRLVQTFHASGAEHVPGASVWQVEAAGGEQGIEIGVLSQGRASIVRARRVLIATGAMERPVPIAGGTLPGVMSAGAAQTMLKSSSMVPEVATVIAGSGPLALLVAWQLARAGAPLAAVWITAPRERVLDALAELPRALGAPRYLLKGLRWLRELARLDVRVEYGATRLRAEGSERLTAVRAQVGGHERRVEAGLLLLHEGVVPSVQLPMSAGCRYDYNPAQHAFVPRLDAFGNTTVAGLMVAGDGGGIGGAEAAEAAGRLAAFEAARALGYIDARRRDHLGIADRRALASSLRARPWLDRLFEPAEELRAPRDAGITVCRCEGISAGAIVDMVRLGCPGPNQGKAWSRCGMGPCQGRMCALPVTALFALHHAKTPGEIGHYRLRPPVKPLSVAELAALDGLPDPPAGPGGAPM